MLVRVGTCLSSRFPMPNDIIGHKRRRSNAERRHSNAERRRSNAERRRSNAERRRSNAERRRSFRQQFSNGRKIARMAPILMIF